ncbi:DUF4184 family protein [Streptomyces albogriseolus]|uniref:DUF4184 family protein n=1 Tax=Streptomyces albogriseolus TaxID=1887 RepID=UPI0036F70E27
MPFTLSHPAAVLPLLRPPFSAAALVCGTIAPDVPYFLGAAGIPVSAQSWYEPFLNATTSHQLSGTAVPAVFGAALMAAYAVVRRPVAALLPAGLSPAGPHRRGRPLRRAGWSALSLAIGILTHLVWDSFTHTDGYLVTHLDILRTHLAGDLTVARAAQHLSTALGLVAIAVFLRRRLRGGAPAGRDGEEDTLSRAARRAVTAALTVVAVAGAAANTAPVKDYRAAGARDVTEALLSDWATSGGAALACAVLTYAGGWWIHKALTPDRACSTPQHPPCTDDHQVTGDKNSAPRTL